MQGPDASWGRLAAPLELRPKVYWWGKRRGIKGVDHSGSRLIANVLVGRGDSFESLPMSQKTHGQARPYSEPSATIVGTVEELGLEDAHRFCGNAIQMHPHKPGKEQSHRTPTVCRDIRWQTCFSDAR